MANPAFCSIILAEFVRGYVSYNSDGCDLILTFLPLNIVLSKRLESFAGCNGKTSLLTWIGRNPNAILGLREDVESTKEYTQSGLLFGIRYSYLGISNEGKVALISQIKMGSQVSKENRYIFKRSYELGQWCGRIKSTELIFHFLGIKI